jgi:hypothetical protein
MAGGRPFPTSANRRGILPAGFGNTAFDVTAAVRQLSLDLCTRLDELRHIDVARIVFRLCQTRRAGQYGVQATMTPLRFRNGVETTTRRGGAWRIHPLPVDAAGQPALYLLSLYVPRFLDLPREEKAAVVLHELWHASPQFDGDLRRFGRGNRFHGRGCDHFHAEMRLLAKRWAAVTPPDAFPWLSDDFAALRARHGRIFGGRFPTPRLVRAAA